MGLVIRGTGDRWDRERRDVAGWMILIGRLKGEWGVGEMCCRWAGAPGEMGD